MMAWSTKWSALHDLPIGGTIVIAESDRNSCAATISRLRGKLAGKRFTLRREVGELICRRVG